jgi:hypothetical protein
MSSNNKAESKRQPSPAYAALTLFQMTLSGVIIALGINVFLFTPEYYGGAFIGGAITMLLSIYRLIILVIRWVGSNNQHILKHKRKLTFLTIAFSIFSFTTGLVAVNTDGIAAYLLLKIEYNQCAYTPVSLANPCSNPDCPDIHLPNNTCYCCYILEGYPGGRCSVSYLLGAQYYYSSVNSCYDIQSTLMVLLFLLSGLHLLNATLSAVGVFITRPVKIVDKKNKFIYKAMKKILVNKEKINKNDIEINREEARENENIGENEDDVNVIQTKENEVIMECQSLLETKETDNEKILNNTI